MKHVIPLSALVLSFSALAAAGNIKCVANHGAADLNMPENSLAAFSNAVQRASEIVNLAVRATKDDVPVISHDASLKRTMNWDVKIAARTYKDILATGSYQWNGENSGYKIATLGEALDIEKRLESLGLSCGATFAGRSCPFFKRLLMLRTEGAALYARIRPQAFSRRSLP